MGYGADDFAVLDDRAAAHECGQVGTTVFKKIYICIGSLGAVSSEINACAVKFAQTHESES